jgi:hypothetical protein
MPILLRKKILLSDFSCARGSKPRHLTAYQAVLHSFVEQDADPAEEVILQSKACSISLILAGSASCSTFTTKAAECPVSNKKSILSADRMDRVS